MGMDPDAILAFGIDIGGEESEWHFKDGLKNYHSPELEDEDAYIELDEIIDDLFAEFAGYKDESQNKWDLVRESGLDQNRYGTYSYSGHVINLSNYRYRSSWEARKIDSLENPPQSEIDKLNKFIEFLDSKGLVLKSEFRKPSWLLLPFYG